MENQLKDCLTIQVSKEDVESPDFDLSNHIVKKFKKGMAQEVTGISTDTTSFPII